MMWNFVLDDKGGPLYPGTKSCGGGCRGVVTLKGNTYVLNEECESRFSIGLVTFNSAFFHMVDYAMAHASRAVIPRIRLGQFGKRIDSKVTGSQSKSFLVTAYATAGPLDTRYSVVVMNTYVLSQSCFEQH